jgi:hypothetical protein
MRSFSIFILLATIALSIASKLKFGPNVNALRSCEGERLFGSILSAKCRGEHGMQNASLNLNNCLGNVDGTLTGGRGFLESCKNCRLSGKTISCECKRRDGTSNPSRIDINSFVGNVNGVLKC